MGRVIELNTERWVTVFKEETLKVSVSSAGRVRFIITQHVPQRGDIVLESNPLDMQTMVQLAGAIAGAFRDEKHEEQPDPAE